MSQPQTGDEFIYERLARGTLTADPETGFVYRRLSSGAWKRIGGWADPDGYLRTDIGLDGIRRGVAIHRIVLIAAGVDIPPGMQTDHINRNPADNRLDNLRVVTCGDNLRNRAPTLRRGVKATGAKLTDEIVLEIRTLAAGGRRFGLLAEEFGVSRSLIGFVARGEIWKHVGGPILPFRYKFADKTKAGQGEMSDEKKRARSNWLRQYNFERGRKNAAARTALPEPGRS